MMHIMQYSTSDIMTESVILTSSETWVPVKPSISRCGYDHDYIIPSSLTCSGIVPETERSIPVGYRGDSIHIWHYSCNVAGSWHWHNHSFHGFWETLKLYRAARLISCTNYIDVFSLEENIQVIKQIAIIYDINSGSR